MIQSAHCLPIAVSHVIVFQGHVGSTNWGISFLVEEAIIPEIVHLAEECGNFAIRGYDPLVFFNSLVVVVFLVVVAD